MPTDVTQLPDNVAGLDGFEFLEFAGDPKQIDKVFTQMGFVPVAKHRSKDVTLYRQNGINFLLNNEPGSQAQHFADLGLDAEGIGVTVTGELASL